MLLRPFATLEDNCRGPFTAARGEGYYLFDREGRKLLDGVSGMWHVPFGYSARELRDAAIEQIDALPAASLFSVSNEASVEAADKLSRALGLNGWRVLFFNSGVEAIEGALHVAELIAANSRRSFEASALPDGFHGNSSYVRQLTRRPPEQTHPSDSLEVIVFEPVQGVAGIRPLADLTIAALRQKQEDGTILISDEVGCGLWRTGSAIAAGRIGINPDMLVVSKGLTNGYTALSAVLLSPAVTEMFGGICWDDGRTTGGSPLACRLLTASLELMARSNHARDANIRRLRSMVSEIAARYSVESRTAGLMAGIELPLRTELDVDQRRIANSIFIEKGILNRIAADGRTVTLAPGYEFGDTEFDYWQPRLRDALDTLITIFATK